MATGSEREPDAIERLIRGYELNRRQLLVRAGVLGAGSLGIGWLLEACGAGAGPATGGTGGGGAPRKGGTVTWGIVADPVQMTPFGSINTSQYETCSLIYESLLGWDKNLNIKPALAESYQIVDPTTYVFKLRKGVRFHSGKELTAGDVKYSIELQKSPPPPGIINSYYPKIASVAVVDPLTVKITMSQPDATLLGYLAWGRYSWIVPTGFYDQGDTRSRADGTGPFKLVEYVPNDHVKLARHDAHWNAGQVYLDQVILKVLADEQARVAAVRSGAVQGTTVSADSAHQLANVGSVQVLKGLTAAFRELEFTVHGTGKPWDNVKVRQAVNLALNRQDIVDKVYAGDAVDTSKIPPGYGRWALSESDLKSKYEKFQLAGARKLMEEAGFAGGFSVVMQTIANAEYVDMAQVIKQHLAQIKIDITVQPLEIGSFAKNNSTGAFDWQLTARGMRGDPIQFLSDFNPAGSVYGAWFKGGYSNPELTNLYNQALTTPEPDKRLPLFQRMQEIVLTDWPLIPIVDAMKYQVVSKNLKNMYVAYDDSERGLVNAWLG